MEKMWDLGGQPLATPGRDLVSMSDCARMPIRLAVKVASLMQEEWQRVWMREAIPLLVSATWGAGYLDLRMSEGLPDELEDLVDSVTGSMDVIGLLRPERVVAFLLVDLEQFYASDLERILLRLSDRFPEAKIEALPLHEGGSIFLELVVAAGES